MDGLDSEALAIVEEGLALPPGPARDAFVRTRTAGNGPLHARVEDLLSRSALLETDAFETPLRPIRLPERVGPFRITGKIADGGMGVVARGERDDGVYAQTVAIKFIRGEVGSGAARDRFEAERRILARLDHPNIARIVDGGTAEGQPWLAMEYVAGRPLTEALDERAATLDQRLAAFLEVCEAVAVAHRNLVVHADIKPGNVLMRADGAIKLLDFGIARLIVDLEEDAGDAAPHPLTRGYAAPERAGGGAPTVAGDIYSLGLLLREILPEKPGPDLDAILARATAPAPAERYPDIAALADDIRAWRDHYPVAARTDAGRFYRGARFLRRHRAGAIVTAAVMLLLAGAALVATLAYVRAEQSRVEAERRFDEVRQLSRFMLFDLYDDLADAPGTLPIRVRLAETARRFLEQLQRVPDAPPDLRLDIARGWRRLAMVEGVSGTSNLGRPERAREALARAEAEARAILAGDPRNAGALAELGWIDFGRWTLLGSSAESARIPVQAERRFAEALAVEPGLTEARLGLLNARRARGVDLIWADRPREAMPLLRATLAELRGLRLDGRLAREARALEVNLLARLGDAVYYAGDIPGALVPYREADTIIRAELARRPSLVWTDKLGEAKFNLSGTLSDVGGQREAALAEARDGVVALERALSFGPDVNLERRLTILYGQEALILDGLGRRTEALAVSERGIALRQRRLAAAPSEPQNRRALAVGIPNHARMLAAAGRRADACAASRSGLEQWRILRRNGDLGQRDASVEVPQTEAAVRQYCG